MPEPAYSKQIGKALATLAHMPDPLERLDAIRRVHEAVERLEQEAAKEARAAGATWRRIGALYGISKQAAQQRFRRPSGRATGVAADEAGGPPAGAGPGTRR